MLASPNPALSSIGALMPPPSRCFLPRIQHFPASVHKKLLPSDAVFRSGKEAKILLFQPNSVSVYKHHLSNPFPALSTKSLWHSHHRDHIYAFTEAVHRHVPTVIQEDPATIWRHCNPPQDLKVYRSLHPARWFEDLSKVPLLSI